MIDMIDMIVGVIFLYITMFLLSLAYLQFKSAFRIGMDKTKRRIKQR